MQINWTDVILHEYYFSKFYTLDWAKIMLSPTNGLLEGKKTPEDLNKGNAINWNGKRGQIDS